jgi:hypothetical protein
MDLPTEDDFQLEDHLNKCRCCFRTMAEDQKFIKISENHQKKFFELTQMKVSLFIN